MLLLPLLLLPLSPLLAATAAVVLLFYLAAAAAVWVAGFGEKAVCTRVNCVLVIDIVASSDFMRYGEKLLLLLCSLFYIRLAFFVLYTSCQLQHPLTHASRILPSRRSWPPKYLPGVCDITLTLTCSLLHSGQPKRFDMYMYDSIHPVPPTSTRLYSAKLLLDEASHQSPCTVHTWYHG